MTIDVLPVEILLEIFDFYQLDAVERSRGGRPWKWHRLAHVCQRWRHVVALSPLRLDLRILCKAGVGGATTIEPILDAWPTLPIVVRYKGCRNSKPRSGPGPGNGPGPLPGNVVVALRRYAERVSEIDIGVTGLALETVVDAIRGGPTFPALERVRMTSNDTNGLSVLPSPGASGPTRGCSPSPLSSATFLGGSTPRLRDLYLDGVVVPFPELGRLISSARDLVELRLCNVTSAGYFSQDALVDCLSALARLRRLEVHFHSSASLPTPRVSTGPPPPATRAALPSLTFLAFHGACGYLEGLVSRIDFPSLTFVIIKFPNEFVFQIPQLCQFIARVDALKSPNEVVVKPSQDNASITLTQRGERRRNLGELFLVISGGPLDWQLSSTTQIFTQLSPLLSGVKTFAIGKYPSSPVGEEYVDSEQWLELFRPFRRVWSVRVTERLVPDVALALGGVTDDMASGVLVLPALISLFLEGHRDYPSVQEAAERFVAQRRLSGHHISLLG